MIYALIFIGIVAIGSGVYCIVTGFIGRPYRQYLITFIGFIIILIGTGLYSFGIILKQDYPVTTVEQTSVYKDRFEYENMIIESDFPIKVTTIQKQRKFSTYNSTTVLIKIGDEMDFETKEEVESGENLGD